MSCQQPEPLIVFAVGGRAVPWKAPTVTKQRGAFAKKSTVNWQKTVRDFALMNWRQAGYRKPHLGPVVLCLTFRLHCDGRPQPDLTNLVKAAEDALKETAQAAGIIEDDRQVLEQHNRILWVHSPQEEGVEIALYPIT